MASKSMAFSQIDVRKTQFTWKVDNFSSLFGSISTENRLKSPNFNVTSDDGVKCFLSVWPNGVNNNSSAFLSISLSLSSTVNVNLTVKAELNAVDSVGRKCFEQTRTFSINNINANRQDFATFIPKNLLTFKDNGILQNNVLTLCCELHVVFKDSIEKIGESIQQQPINFDRKVLNAFEEQLEKQAFSDVKLVSSCGKELQAHKFVLAAHSPVFSAMLTNDMTEKNENTIVIKDLNYDSLKEMLRFMYAGRVENLEKLADGILAAQEKYQIEGLKELCEEYFFQNINIENAVETLILSIRYNLSKIKLVTKQFIRCHAKDVSNSAAFKAVDEPHLLAEIVNVLADQL